MGVDGGCWVLLGPLFLLCCSSAHANCMQLHVKGSCLLAAASPVPGCSCMPLHLRQNWLSVPQLCGRMHRVLQMGWLTVSDRAKITHYTSILITEPVAACVIISQRSSRPLGAAMCGIAAGAAAHSPGMHAKGGVTALCSFVIIRVTQPRDRSRQLALCATVAASRRACCWSQGQQLPAASALFFMPQCL
jgi:hypothetical protein